MFIHSSKRFDGLILSKGFLPSESDRISEDFHFNVINVGFVLFGEVPTIVVHTSNNRTKFFFIPLILIS